MGFVTPVGFPTVVNYQWLEHLIMMFTCKERSDLLTNGKVLETIMGLDSALFLRPEGIGCLGQKRVK
jgi:hypothetical protein